MLKKIALGVVSCLGISFGIHEYVEINQNVKKGFQQFQSMKKEIILPQIENKYRRKKFSFYFDVDPCRHLQPYPHDSWKRIIYNHFIQKKMDELCQDVQSDHLEIGKMKIYYDDSRPRKWQSRWRCVVDWKWNY